MDLNRKLLLFIYFKSVVSIFVMRYTRIGSVAYVRFSYRIFFFPNSSSGFELLKKKKNLRTPRLYRIGGFSDVFVKVI